MHVYVYDMHVCAYGCGCAHLCLCMYRAQVSTRCLLCWSPSYLLRQTLSLHLYPTDWLDWLACKPLGSSVSGMRGSHYKSHPFTWVLRIWVQSSCLHTKHFPYEPTSYPQISILNVTLHPSIKYWFFMFYSSIQTM